jgi:glucosamine-6-phosphate deaminase
MGVEEIALRESGEQLVYPPQEKIGVLVAGSFPRLGTLTALRFLEWVQENPEGVVSLPTGKTPEYFIKEVQRFLTGWNRTEVQEELAAAGIDPGVKPGLRGLRFVQIDEFYPMNPLHQNSFHYYVNRYYIDRFGLDRSRALLIDAGSIGLPEGAALQGIWPDDEVDLTLRYRTGRTRLERRQKRVIEEIDQWCSDYESGIRRMGGIGFFLGGIGPDGHIGFNVRGSDHFSTTRLTRVNYETQAAAAADLGGIEVARKRLVITIGLQTITCNPSCTAIIMAAGEAKARIVADSIQSEPHVHYPATALHKLKNGRFYLTSGAAKHLTARQCAALSSADSIPPYRVEQAVVDLALKACKRVTSLTPADFKLDPIADLVLRRRDGNIKALTREIHDRLVEKIGEGSRIMTGKVFLHTEPHHDDLMLGYLPFIVRHIREHSNRHVFATLTSGFTAVTNVYMLRQTRKLKRYLVSSDFEELAGENYFDPGNRMARNRDVWQYLDGVAAGSAGIKDAGEMRRLVRNLVEVYEERDPNMLKDRADELLNYFTTQYPGKKDLPHIQKLKGMCREWEADCLWGYFGWNTDAVHHLRLGFYTGDIFTQEPTLGRDVDPIVRLLGEVNPDVVTLALDPEASGPDTHYKVLQAVTEALRIHAEAYGRGDIQILGYRNVWYRFNPAEADLMVPVSLNMFSLQESAFMNTFVSQKDASFPSYEHEGPFHELAQKIQIQQYRALKCCLGREYFYEHESALIRATRGLVFLKEMTLEELLEHSRELRRKTEYAGISRRGGISPGTQTARSMR